MSNVPKIPDAPPRVEYQRRLKRNADEAARLERASDRLANSRLIVFLAAMVWALVAWRISAVWLFGLLLPVAAFLVLAVLHDRALRGLRQRKILQQFYEEGLGRLNDSWPGRGDTGSAHAFADHPYAEDLDLFGEGSLFQLLSRSRTRTGAATLATWLQVPASADEVVRRQEAVEELRPHLDLREALALEGTRIAEDVAPDALEHWVKAPRLLSGQRTLPLSRGLTLLGVLSLVPLLVWGTLAPALAVMTLNLIFLSLHARDLKALAASLEQPRRELKVLAGVLRSMERQSFTSEKLRSLHENLRKEGREASEAIQQLDRLVTLYEMQANQLFAPVALLLLWGIHVGQRLETWRRTSGAQVPAWLDALGQFEALNSLAAFAYERSGAVYPELCAEGPVLEAAGLSHPLLPRAACIANSLSLDAQRPLLIVSGSNMSGKSTLLRTLGINVVLAMAGAPVCAERLRISPLIPGATMRVHDSIQGGVSRFYAEIKRLKQLLDMARQGPAESRPLLFLIDEILHGTNSRDRKIGAEALLRRLVQAGAIGLVTTHDLAITDLSCIDGIEVVNAHFEDSVGESGPVFDYTLRPGVVQHSNALALMRSVGLDV